MKKLWTFCVALAVAGFAAGAADLSGAWTSGITFASGSVSLATTFTLQLAGPSWQLTSSWDPTLRDASRHSLVLTGSLGPLTLIAGASVQLAARPAASSVSARDPFLWSANGFSFRSGFVSLELALGNVTFRLTLASGPEE